MNTTSEWQLPVCDACHRSLCWRWWAYTLLGTLASLSLSALVALMPHKIDAVGRWMLFAVCALFITIFTAAILPGFLVRPYRIKVVDAERGVVRLRFRNVDYVRLLQGLVNAHDRPAEVAPDSALKGH